MPGVSPPKPANEALRLLAIERYRLGGIGREPAFDRITRLAADLFDVPISLVSIIGSDTQCFRGACGLDASDTPRDHAFCAFAILADEVMVVPDATKDPRFRDNPFVTGDPWVRFYAGAPLRVAGGETVGTLCLIAPFPRTFDAEEARRLEQLAQTVVDLIELRVERFASDEHRRQLGAERELLKLTVENVSEGVALFGDDLRLTLWNEGFMRLFGYSRDLMFEGAEATTLMRITAERGELGPGDPQQIATAFAQAARQTSERNLELRRSDGRILDVHRKTISGGRFILTARDVTDERQMARLKDELVSTVSHELRTPLTSISGALGLLAGGAAGELAPAVKTLVDLARRNAERLVNLVNDLLDMDKLQSGELHLQFEDKDLGALLADAIDQNRPFADRFGVELELDLPGTPVCAPVDAARLFQVLTNLLSNACKFAPAGSTVRVSLAQADDFATITVSDAGPGISAEFRPRLFERFSQEDGKHQQGHAGTGLGLAISKAIVESHRGTIDLDPHTTVGATFHVRLPLCR